MSTFFSFHKKNGSRFAIFNVCDPQHQHYDRNLETVLCWYESVTKAKGSLTKATGSLPNTMHTNFRLLQVELLVKSSLIVNNVCMLYKTNYKRLSSLCTKLKIPNLLQNIFSYSKDYWSVSIQRGSGGQASHTLLSVLKSNRTWQDKLYRTRVKSPSHHLLHHQ